MYLFHARNQRGGAVGPEPHCQIMSSLGVIVGPPAKRRFAGGQFVARLEYWYDPSPLCKMYWQQQKIILDPL